MTVNELIYIIKHNKSEGLDSPIWLWDEQCQSIAVRFMFDCTNSDVLILIDNGPSEQSDLTNVLNKPTCIDGAISYLNDSNAEIQVLAANQRDFRKSNFYTEITKHNSIAKRLKVWGIPKLMYQKLSEHKTTSEFMLTDCDQALLFVGKFDGKGRLAEKRPFINFHDKSFFDTLNGFFRRRLDDILNNAQAEPSKEEQ